MKEFITRTLTALVLIAIVYSATRFLNHLYFSAFLFVIITLAALELIQLADGVLVKPILAVLNGAVIALFFTFGRPDLLMALIMVLIFTGLFFLFSIQNSVQLSSFIRDFGIHALVIFYLYIPLYFLLLLKKLHPHYLFFLILVIAVGDTGAYIVGRRIGKHKIYPVASPKKSLEGLLAAIAFAALSAWVSIQLFPLYIPVTPWKLYVVAGLMGFLSQLSDPIESLFKRAAQKKDSGSVLPGHGGILDRIDSYIFCAPVFYYLIVNFWNQ